MWIEAIFGRRLGIEESGYERTFLMLSKNLEGRLVRAYPPQGLMRGSDFFRSREWRGPIHVDCLIDKEPPGKLDGLDQVDDNRLRNGFKQRVGYGGKGPVQQHRARKLGFTRQGAPGEPLLGPLFELSQPKAKNYRARAGDRLGDIGYGRDGYFEFFSCSKDAGQAVEQVERLGEFVAQYKPCFRCKRQVREACKNGRTGAEAPGSNHRNF